MFPDSAPISARPKFWHYDELLGWTHKPGQRGHFNHPDFSIDIAVNSHGQRDSEYTLDRTRKKRMLILGDSFAWGFGVQHHERFSELMETSQPGWEIINAAMSGYGTDQQFLYLKQLGTAFNPDVVLLLFYRNDVENNIRGEGYFYFKPYFVLRDSELIHLNYPVPQSVFSQRIKRFMCCRTYLGKKLFAVMHRRDLVSKSSSTPNKTGVTYKEKQSRKFELTYQLLKGISDICNKNGAQFVLVSAPMETERRSFLQDVADEVQISYLPLDSYFDASEASFTFPHDNHWNPKGHEIAASAIEDYLQTLEIFDSLPKTPTVKSKMSLRGSELIR